MNINKIQINGYGKLHNKNMELKKGINLIYGDNEVGKSTLLNYISNTMYGISKNKNGKQYSDYEKYMPWDAKEFSGKIEYELDNGTKYEVFRDFRRNSAQIFDENMLDISNQFNVDKNKGNEFFYEQTKIDEELFQSTFLTGQQQVKLEGANQQMLIQKISNLVGTGQDNVSYKLALSRLNKKQLDEVGTTRSREKPINILTREIERLEKEKEELEEYENKKYEIEGNKNNLKDEVDILEIKNDIVKKVKILKDKQVIENEKIKVQKEIENENTKKIEELVRRKEKYEKEERATIQKNEKVEDKVGKITNVFTLIFIILVILCGLSFTIIKNTYLKIGSISLVPIIILILIIWKNILEQQIEQEKLDKIKKEIYNLDNEINLIQESNEKISKEIVKVQEKSNLEINLERQRIRSKYMHIKNLDMDDLMKEENIETKMMHLQKMLNKKNLEIHKQELDKNNIEPKLDNLSRIVEQLENDKRKYANLKNKEKSIELAKDVLADAYQQMKEQVTPKFTAQLSNNIGVITKGKYSKAGYTEEEGLVVELENGRYVNANKLSVGTIDQLYLSLRLSMIDDLSEEKLPIILDESFAYFDNKRLENILQYLSNNFYNRQIIIFTCTNREKNIMEQNGIQFQYIDMNI